MSAPSIADLRALLAAASPPRLVACGRGVDEASPTGHGSPFATVRHGYNEDDCARLIAAAINALPLLLDVVEKAEWFDSAPEDDDIDAMLAYADMKTALAKARAAGLLPKGTT